LQFSAECPIWRKFSEDRNWDKAAIGSYATFIFYQISATKILHQPIHGQKLCGKDARYL